MNSYGYYFPSYTTMLPLYSSFFGGYGLTGGSTQKSSSSSSKSKRQKWEENQNRYSGQQSAEDNERANKSTTLGKEFTSGDGRDGFGGGFGGSSSGKGNSAGSSNQGHGYTDKAAMDAMTQGLADMGLSAAAKAGLAMGFGAPTNAALGFGLSGTPGALGATAGKAAAAAMGMTTGTTTGAMLGGLLGSLAGPIGGLLGGLVGPALGGLVADALGMRDEEATRDSFEDAFGTITGRQIGAAYAGSLAAHNQDMATINDISLAQAMNDAIADSKSLSDQLRLTLCLLLPTLSVLLILLLRGVETWLVLL